MIAVIDYGVGNLFSLTASLKYLGADVKVTGEKEEIEAADRIILQAHFFYVFLPIIPP